MHARPEQGRRPSPRRSPPPGGPGRASAPRAGAEGARSDEDAFADLARIVHGAAGIALRPGKQMLVLSRLSKRMRELGLQGLDAYVGYLEQNFDQEIEGLINSLSTNVTNFFRHPEHFDFLANEIRARRNAGQRRFRFWSAACSTGEEPYSIAMTALHAHEGGGADVRVLATDISTRVLDVAMRGEYLAEELAAVPRPMMRWLGVAPGRPASRAVADEVKRLIRFRHYNLSSRPLPLDGVLDAVFCRNVMIYFDRELRERLVAQAARVLRPGGLFFVGQSESLSGLRHPLRLVQPAVYQRP